MDLDQDMSNGKILIIGFGCTTQDED